VKRIIVTTDFSKESFVAFEHAKQQADAIGKDNCEINIVTVLENLSPTTTYLEFGLARIIDDPVRKEWVRKALASLRELSKKHFSSYLTNETVLAAKASAAEELCELADTKRAEMIIISSHGRSGVKRLLLGSVTERVLRLAACPVLVVFADDRGNEISHDKRHVLVLTDLSEDSYAVLPYVNQQLKVDSEEGAELTLLYVSGDITRASFGLTLGENASEIQEEMEKQAGQELDKLSEQHFKEQIVSKVVHRGEKATYDEIAEYAKKHFVDLIIIATHGYSGIRRAFLGGVSEKLVRISPCPVLVVRSGITK
jgi:nucleotide-binding universal stress UspA family protein